MTNPKAATSPRSSCRIAHLAPAFLPIPISQSALENDPRGTCRLRASAESPVAGVLIASSRPGFYIVYFVLFLANFRFLFYFIYFFGGGC